MKTVYLSWQKSNADNVEQIYLQKAEEKLHRTWQNELQYLTGTSRVDEQRINDLGMTELFEIFDSFPDGFSIIQEDQ